MSQLMHCLMLLFIVFILAEIRTVLLYDAPYGDGPIAIWNESYGAHTEEIKIRNSQI
jgi:hypothetical protein